MKKLIITINTYDWVMYCAGMIIQENEHDFELIRLFRDNFQSIFWCRNLCFDAIYSQRRFDLEKLGREINIKRVSSLNYNEADFNLKKLVTELQVYNLFNNISELYIPHHAVFKTMFKPIAETKNAELFIYGDSEGGEEETRKIILSQKVYKKKLELRKLMVGIHDKKQLDIYKPIERFYN